MKNITSTSIANNTINASEASAFQRNRPRLPNFANGQVITAVIAQKTAETATLREKSGFIFEVPSGDVRGEVGESVTFEVLSATERGLVMRQVERQQMSFKKELAKQADLADLKDLMEANDFAEREVNVLDGRERAEAQLEERLIENRALAKLRRQALGASGGAASAAVRALLAEGVKVTKLELSDLTNMLTAIKKDPGISLPSSEKEEKNLLAALDIPETDKNKAMAEEAARKIDAVREMQPENAVMFLHNNEKTISLDNLYNYAKSAIVLEKQSPVSADEVKRIFALEGIEANAENLKAAELFIAADVPVNKENIDKYNFLMNMKDKEAEGLLRLVLLAGREGGNPLTADFYGFTETKPLSYEGYAELVKNVSIIKPEYIDISVAQNIPLTIKDLSALAEEIPPELPNYELTDEQKTIADTARTALLEISLKLSYEAANALHQKQIQIDVLALTDALDALKERELEMYANRLAAVDAPVTEENIAKAAEAVDAAKKLRTLPESIICDILEGRVSANLRAVTSYTPSVITAEKTVEMYTTFEAKPTARYGDFISNEKEQLARILVDSGIPVSEANIRAAHIAAKNNMEITHGNLLDIKAVDAKLYDVSIKLVPMVAAQMVKDGYNPLDRHIDDVLKYIETFDGKYGEVPGETLAEKIYALDRAKTLDDESRKAMMAIYKALSIISKNGSAAIGAALKADAQLTLGRLLEMSESLGARVDIAAGDDGRPYRATEGNYVRNVLGSIEARTDNAEYYGMRMVDTLAKNLTPSAYDGNILGADIETLTETLTETLAQEPQSHTELLEQAKELSQKAAEVSQVPAEVLKRLGDAGVPLTIQNIANFRKLQERRLFSDISGESTNEGVKEAIESAADSTSLEKTAELGFMDYLRDIYNAIAQAAEDSADDAERVGGLLDSMRLLYNTGGKLGYYLPVKFNGRIADINVYVLDDLSKDSVRVEMLLDTLLGEVRVKLDITAEHTETAITVDGRDYSEDFADFAKQLNEAEGRSGNISKLPPHIRNAASAVLRYAEALERRG